MFPMNLICIMTSERNQSQRLHTVSFPLWLPGKGKSRDEEQISGCQGLGLRGGFDNKGAQQRGSMRKLFLKGRSIVLSPHCGFGYKAPRICQNS